MVSRDDPLADQTLKPVAAPQTTSLTRLRRMLPELDALPSVRVPPIREHELAPLWVSQMLAPAREAEPLYLLQLLRSIGRRPAPQRASFNLPLEVPNNPSGARCRALARQSPDKRLAAIHRMAYGRTLVPDLDSLLALEQLQRALAPGANDA